MAWSLTRSAITPPTRRHLMGILLVIVLVNLGLALRAVAVNRRTSLAGSETSDDPAGVVDSYARTSLLVLFCLVALFALGRTYGNVLGAGAGR
jgi:hypothetical protein